MESMEEHINRFFDTYAQRFNRALAGGEPDVESTTACFADYFVESSPLGVIGKTNDKDFKKKIPEVYEFYKKIGITSMEILSKDISIINELHSMAKTQWRAHYKKDDKEGGIDFQNIYLLTLHDTTLKIFAYITGDEQKALQENGLV